MRTHAVERAAAGIDQLSTDMALYTSLAFWLASKYLYGELTVLSSWSEVVIPMTRIQYWMTVHPVSPPQPQTFTDWESECIMIWGLPTSVLG